MAGCAARGRREEWVRVPEKLRTLAEQAFLLAFLLAIALSVCSLITDAQKHDDCVQRCQGFDWPGVDDAYRLCLERCGPP
jgi:hypothetical protein